MEIRLSQLRVQRELATNLQRILGVLDEARPDEIVILPEGALSGYEPKDDAA